MIIQDNANPINHSNANEDSFSEHSFSNNSFNDDSSNKEEDRIINGEDRKKIMQEFSKALEYKRYYPNLHEISTKLSSTSNMGKLLMAKESLISELKENLNETNQLMIKSGILCKNPLQANTPVQTVSLFLRKRIGWGIFHFLFDEEDQCYMENFWNVNTKQVIRLLKDDQKQLNLLNRLIDTTDIRAHIKLIVNIQNEWRIRLFFNKEQTKNRNPFHVKINVEVSDMKKTLNSLLIDTNILYLFNPGENWRAGQMIREYKKENKDSYEKMIISLRQYAKEIENNEESQCYYSIIEEIKKLYENMTFETACKLLHKGDKCALFLYPIGKNQYDVRQLYVDKNNTSRLIVTDEVPTRITYLFNYLKSKKLLSEEHIKKRDELENIFEEILVEYNDKSQEYLIKLFIYFRNEDQGSLPIDIQCANLFEMEKTLKNILKHSDYKHLSSHSYLKRMEEKWKSEVLLEQQQIQATIQNLDPIQLAQELKMKTGGKKREQKVADKELIKGTKNSKQEEQNQ